jgi:transcriptional regulator with XRE-family HTH domain
MPRHTALTPEPQFSEVLLAIRRERLCKQSVLARQVDCSEAAVSFWEVGRRVPSNRMFRKIFQALQEAGASASELVMLKGTWARAVTAKVMRRGASQAATAATERAQQFCVDTRPGKGDSP